METVTKPLPPKQGIAAPITTLIGTASRRSRRRRDASPAARFWQPTLAVIAVLLLWEVSSRTGLVPSSALPPFSEVMSAVPALVTSGDFWAATGQTLFSTVVGLVIMAIIAFPMAILTGLSKFARESTSLPFELLKPIPPVAMIPLGLLLWGPSETMKLVLIVFGAFWPFYTQLTYGVREIDTVASDMAKSYQLSPWTVITRVYLPSLLPFATTGFRVSASIALIVSVVTELIGGARGLGRSIMVAQSSGSLDTMYALILFTGVLGLTINYLLEAAERPLLFWHATYRKEAAS